jgi:hypothetical protein
MIDETILTHDAATATFHDDASGITVDDDGGVEIAWDEVDTVRVDQPPHAEAFDTKEFYKLPATVAKPIPQPYQFQDETMWLKKPREELKRAAWSLDNAPWTLDHPETGMVKNVDDIHGFWKSPRYIDSTDDLDADLHIPVDDEEAKGWVEKHNDVSVGFYNRIERVDEYDGIVGGSDDEDVDLDGYQTQMYFDHCASVRLGRCSSENGCGIDSPLHGHAAPVDAEGFKYPLRITNTDDGAEGTVSMQSTTDAPEGIYTEDGDWYGISPSENPDGDSPKYPLNTCNDVKDAWNLRNHGSYSVDTSTLEARIKRAAKSKDCPTENRPWEDSYDGGIDALAESIDRYTIDCASCADCDCDNENTGTTMEIDFDDLSADAALGKLASEHDGASERLDELQAAEEAAEATEETLSELDDIEDVQALVDEVQDLRERKEDLEERVDELERPKMEEHAKAITEHTDRYGEDAEEVIEHFDADLDALADKREEIEELAGSYDEQTANADSGESTGDGVQTSGKYAKTPWD